jgi:pyridoxine 4-dehydrogenase
VEQHRGVTTSAVPQGGTFDLAGDLTVHRIGFGAMQLAGPGVFGPPADRELAIRVLRRAVELGVDHIDTSDFYGPWVVNELIAEALRPYDENLVLVTKIGAYRDLSGGWLPLAHPDALKAQVYDNLRRLGLDALDLVYLRHMDDQPGITLEDQLGALVELRELGLVREIGLSNVSLAQFERARVDTPIASVQNLYNVVNRSSADLVRRTAELGAAFVPFFPLGSGFADSHARDHSTLRTVAERHGATQAQVALAWLLRRSPNILLIPGTSSLAHLEENCAVGRLELTDNDVAELDALVADGDTLETIG